MSKIYFNIVLLTGAIIVFFVGLIIFIKRRNSPINRLWFETSLAGSLWSLFYLWVINAPSENSAHYLVNILNLIGLLVALLWLRFVLYFLNITNNRYKKLFYALSLLAFLIYLSSFFNFFIKGLVPKFIFNYYIVPDVGYICYVIFFSTVVLFGLYLLLISYKKVAGIKALQIRYITIASIMGFTGGGSVFLLAFDVQVPPYLLIFFTLFPLVITYAIIKYRLMNIRLILTRSILYGVLVGAVASFFALSVLVVGEMIGGNTRTSKIITYIITSFIVVIALDPVKRTWAKITDNIFYKDKIDYQLVLREAGDVVAREIDLQKLLQGLSDLLVAKLKIKGIAVLVASDNIFHLVAGTGQNKKISISSDFVAYLRDNPQLVIIEEAIRQQENQVAGATNVFNRFVSEAEVLKAEMVIPVLEQDKLTAIFLIAGKNSGDLYSNDDVNFFQVLVPQVATAIEKSKLYEEVEKFNRELQQKVEERTKSLQEANLGLEERNKFLTAMQAVTNMVSRTMNLKQINQMIANSIAVEFGYIGGILSFLDEQNNVLRISAVTENEQTKMVTEILGQDPKSYEAQMSSKELLGVRTVLSGEMNISNKMSDFFSPPVDKQIMDKVQAALGVKTIVGLPIFMEDKIIGIIHFLLADEAEQILSLDRDIMIALADEVGIVSRNMRLYNNLQKVNQDLQEANIRLRELDKAKSEFLSIASHQLRTPISAIKGYLSMIIEGDFGKVPKSIDTVVKNLFESASRLARLINIFLNVSRIESGRLKLEKKPLQINSLIDSVIVELINQAKQKNVKLEYKKDRKEPPLILADSDKLREVILNLVDNAIKYTPEGHIDVKVKIEDKNLKFIVEDTGIGIDSEEVKTLFRKFVRGSGVAQIHTGGSGLGLFIAQKIIKEHGGEVWAESDGKGKGSRFQFVLPIYDGNEISAYKEMVVHSDK